MRLAIKLKSDIYLTNSVHVKQLIHFAIYKVKASAANAAPGSGI